MESIRLEAAQYLQECKENLAAITAAQAEFYAAKATELFFAFYEATAKPLRDAVEILCVLNTAPQPEISRAGLQALFPNLIEKLNDAFQPELCDLYDQVFAQVISFCRQLPPCELLDAKLHDFALPDEAALLARRAKLICAKKFLTPERNLKKILVLSRVTIGADVAITSVIISHLLQQFPKTEIVLLGSEKLFELYGGETRIRVRKIQYGRGSGLVARLLTWLDVIEAVENEIGEFTDEEFCIFDPDSRLTQLGLLPLLPAPQEARNYFYFPSRSFQHPEKTKIGELTSFWTNETLQTHQQHFPFLTLPNEFKNTGAQLIKQIRQRSKKPFVVLSFGVGGNLAKRINEAFEIRFVVALADQATLIIDKGISTFELSQIQKITNALVANGKIIVELDENNFSEILVSDNWSNGVFTWQGGIGSFASIIQASDCYIGYDSSGQHFAAACNIPLITIFVNSGLEIFAERWTPTGAGEQKLIHVEGSKSFFNTEMVSNLIQKILTNYQQLIQ